MGGGKLSDEAGVVGDSFCDVSSIMIMPDQIYNNNFNLLDDEDDREENEKQQE